MENRKKSELKFLMFSGKIFHAFSGQAPFDYKFNRQALKSGSNKINGGKFGTVI